MERFKEKLPSYLVIATALIFSACQRNMSTSDFQTQFGQLSYQAATMISNAKQMQGVTSNGRGIADYSTLGNSQMSAFYNNTAMTASPLSVADSCFTNVSQLQQQVLSGQISGQGLVQYALSTMVQCELQIIQQQNSYNTALYRNASPYGQTNMAYNFNWPQYGSYNAFNQNYSQNTYPWLNNLGSQGTLVNQTVPFSSGTPTAGAPGYGSYPYPYQSAVTTGQLQSYLQQ